MLVVYVNDWLVLIWLTYLFFLFTKKAYGPFIVEDKGNIPLPRAIVCLLNFILIRYVISTK